MVLNFSSKALQIAFSSNQIIIANALRASMPAPKKSVSQLLSSYAGIPIQHMLWQTFLNSENFLTIDTIEQEIDNDPTRADAYRHEAMMFTKLMEHIETLNIVQCHTEALKAFNDLLEAPLLDGSLNPTEAEDISSAVRIMNDYAESIRNFITVEQLVEQDDVTDMLNLLPEFYWDSDSKSDKLDDKYPQMKAEDRDSHAFELDRLIRLLKTPATSDQLCKFALNNTFGSTGLALASTIRFPILINLLPYRWSRRNADDIWNTRMKMASALDPEQSKPENIGDLEQTKLERNSSYRFKTMDLDGLSSDRIKRSLGADISGTSTPLTPGGRQPPFGHSSSSRRNNNTVPDDSSYEPDSALASRAADMTKEYRDTHPTNMEHDHMTRFSTTSEASTTVSRTSVRQTDWTFQTRTRYGTTRYLVTYTRKSKKPIFSIVPM